VLWALGSPVTIPSALWLESLSYAARTAFFFLPSGIGAQEAAFFSLGQHLGLSNETVLALVIVKRGREVVVGAGGLLAWLWVRRRGQ
jgi:uncharacterized membrane protein YbhN (UPF0104 family)